MNLRFIERNGKMILQQQSVVLQQLSGGTGAMTAGTKWGWQDVPLVKEQAETLQLTADQVIGAHNCEDFDTLQNYLKKLGFK